MRRILGWIALSLALTLAGPSLALPISVDLFLSPADDGEKPIPDPPVFGRFGPEIVTVNLWADPTAAGGGGTFGLQDVLLEATGGITIVSFTCDAGCLKGVPTDATRNALFTAGDDVNGNFAPFTIGTLTLSIESELGALTLTRGTALDGNFIGDSLVVGDVIAISAPEPTSGVLVGAGLASVVARRRRQMRRADRVS